jgi:hypothetical protein
MRVGGGSLEAFSESAEAAGVVLAAWTGQEQAKALNAKARGRIGFIRVWWFGSRYVRR